jgi:hypothetical protein
MCHARYFDFPTTHSLRSLETSDVAPLELWRDRRRPQKEVYFQLLSLARPRRCQTLSANPILYLQTWYALKLSLVVGYYRKGARLGVGGNPQIVVTDRLPFGLQ